MPSSIASSSHMDTIHMTIHEYFQKYRMMCTHPARRRHARAMLPDPYDMSDGEALPKTKSKSSRPAAEFGMTIETRNLYRENSRTSWAELALDDIGPLSQGTSDSEIFALVVRRERTSIEADDPALQLHSITVQSPILKKLLGPVFADYPGINTNLRKVHFHAPFYEFHYRWKRFRDAKPAQEEGMENLQYEKLYDVIAPEIIAGIETQKDLLKNRVMSFQHVWMLFEPGVEIYSRDDDQHRLYLLNSGKYKEMGGTLIYTLSCRYIDCDGSRFGYATTTLVIEAFEKMKRVTDLSVFPSRFQPGIEKIRVQLRDRGKKFESLRGMHYKSFTGFSRLKGMIERYYADASRIMIDCRSFTRYNSASQMALDQLDAESSDASPPTRIATRLSEHHYKLCTPNLKGFSFKAKKWGTFYVDTVHDIVWNDEAFGRLVLPHACKEMILAFAHSQLAKVDEFDDVIEGKGQGVIMLFSGEPGTGKTLTSESVAEEMKRPLYAISAGELGNEASEVEKNLERALELSTNWGAVLLLDECDVFLERRSSTDIQRNQLVSIFLRLLEYYRGVLLMTTNRAADLDPAFESRIHLNLKYPNLQRKSRREIWRGFLKDFQETELDELAAEDLNGREIKNVVKSARLLAAKDEKPLALQHITKVLSVKKGIWGDDPDGDECTEKTHVPKKRRRGYWNKAIAEISR